MVILVINNTTESAIVKGLIRYAFDASEQLFQAMVDKKPTFSFYALDDSILDSLLEEQDYAEKLRLDKHSETYQSVNSQLPESNELLCDLAKDFEILSATVNRHEEYCVLRIYDGTIEEDRYDYSEGILDSLTHALVELQPRHLSQLKGNLQTFAMMLGIDNFEQGQIRLFEIQQKAIDDANFTCMQLATNMSFANDFDRNLKINYTDVPINYSVRFEIDFDELMAWDIKNPVQQFFNIIFCFEDMNARHKTKVVVLPVTLAMLVSIL